MNTPKIAFFLPNLNAGGAEKVMVTLAKEFLAQGIAVDMVLSQKTGTLSKQLPQSICTISLNSSSVLKSMGKLTQYLKQAQPDVLISAMDHSNVVALSAVKLAGIKCKVLATVHTHVSHTPKSLKQKVLFKLIPKLYPTAHKIIAVSHGVANDLVKQFALAPDHIKVIFNPLDREKINSMAQATCNFAPFTEKVPIIITVGRLSEAKDFSTLLKAFKQVLNKQKAHLLFVGHGPLETELKLVAKRLKMEERVTFYGYSANPYPLIKNADLYVLSSKREGFGIALAEALVLGKKIVSTHCPSGPAEILENGKWGKLVPVGDDVKMAEAILSQLMEPEPDSEEFGATTRFSATQIANQYLQTLFPNKKAGE